MICGPSRPSSMSTPATRRPMICAARTAVFAYISSSSIASTRPPRWTLLRNSSPCATRRIAPTTRSPTTNARTSLPLLSATNFWISTFWRVLCSVSMIACATFVESARMTPTPWVPSRSLMMTGAPPTRSMAGSTSVFARTNSVGGMPMS